MMQNDALSRRAFIGAGAAAGLSTLQAQNQAGRPHRIAQVGTGSRGLYWAREMTRNYGDVVSIVGLCDLNPKRAEGFRKLAGLDSVPVFTDFDAMVEAVKPNTLLVTTIDAAHPEYVVKGMERGLAVISEKPLCTDEFQVRNVVAAQRKHNGRLTVAHNARHFPGAKKVKSLIAEGAVGTVLSVDYQEYLDTSHGASYFRRWHRLKELSGTLLCSKAVHHFDQVNWWLDSKPRDVAAQGDLRFYGRNNGFRSSRCRGCPHAKKCQFYFDAATQPQNKALYLDCESEDGYFIDGCVWRQDTNIQDTFSVLVRYENGARLTYTANTFLPYEGQEIVINGTRGRIDWNSYSGGGHKETELRLTRAFGKSEIVPLQTRVGGGAGDGHGGADNSLMDMMFRGVTADPLSIRADVMDGVYASLVGIAGYRSIERGGELVKVAGLLNGA